MSNPAKAQTSGLNVKQLALTGLMTAVLCILGPLSLNIPISPVSISLGGMILGSVVGYLFGTVWLARQQSIGFIEALFLGVVPYLPLDIVKLIVGMAVGSRLRKRLLQAGLLSAQAPVKVS